MVISRSKPFIANWATGSVVNGVLRKREDGWILEMSGRWGTRQVVVRWPKPWELCCRPLQWHPFPAAPGSVLQVAPLRDQPAVLKASQPGGRFPRGIRTRNAGSYDESQEYQKALSNARADRVGSRVSSNSVVVMSSFQSQQRRKNIGIPTTASPKPRQDDRRHSRSVRTVSGGLPGGGKTR